MNKLVLIICLFSYINMSGSFFPRDRAAYYAQQGNWDKASDLLTNLVVESPNKADLLFDSGVALFNKKKFDSAYAYFCNTAKCDNASDLLKEKAHFNAGNTCVELKKLKNAIDQYETVLSINSENKEAKQNLEIVKKMLEQQKKQQNQNKDDKNEKQQDKNNKSKDKQSDKSKDNQGKSDRSSDDDKQEEKRQDDRGDSGSEKSNPDSQRDHEGGSSDKPQDQQNKDEQDSQSGHDEPSEQKKEEQSGNQDKQTESKSQENNSGASTPSGVQRYDKEVQQVLSAVADRDAQANKKMMAVRVKKAAGKYEKNQNNY